jgi:Lon protease-like protein
VREEIEAILQSFPRPLPVFPLAEVVLFPGAVLPLHIFEPRYRVMLRDALAGDRLITMALLKQCNPEEYATLPPFHETVCVGRVIQHEPLDEGQANIALLGLSAGRAEPLESAHPYRTAQVELLTDRFDTDASHELKLEQAFQRVLPGHGDLEELRTKLAGLMGGEQLPAALINTCALTAPLFAMDKLRLLEERSLAQRLDQLVEYLERPWQWN